MPDGAATTVQLGGRELDLRETRFVVDSPADARWIDVRIYHPSFAGMTEREQFEIAFRALDMELGEFAVMSRLGVILPVAGPLPNGQPLSALLDIVRAAIAR